MKNIREGNLYNVETEISRPETPGDTGLETWKSEVRKRLKEILLRQNIPNAPETIKGIFGETLE